MASTEETSPTASTSEDQPTPATPAKATRPKATSRGKGDRTGEGDRTAELEAENARLRQRMAEAGVSADDPRKPQEPSFGISEGTRAELDRTGRANSPFTGRPLTRDDLPAKSDQAE